jgi:anionic cell wall polymer biosynthesis LytR-Cps2A-Psr (LCP) family protein
MQMRGVMASQVEESVVNFVLPFNQVKSYPELFRLLESNVDHNLQLVLTNLEEAFLNFSAV